MNHVMCSSVSTFKPEGCDKQGTYACSKCRLVQYCSKECQGAHWPLHKKDCNHPLNKSDWCPTWVTQKRPPVFVTDTDSHAFFGSRMHRPPEYLWGNTFAADYLRLAHNEGVAESVHRDFNLCFAASGDIRNMVMTVNGLPEDYQGHCKILLNDHSSLVTIRNVLILHTLLCSDTSIELAAEAAVHLMYSAALRASGSAQLNHSVDAVYGDILPLSQSPFLRSWILSNPMSNKSLDVRGRGKLSVAQSTADLFFKEPFAMLQAVHSLHHTQKTMRDVMLNPGRVDYRDRYIYGLERSHRLSFLRFRETGILLPFSDTGLKKDFGYPNRLLFSPEGEWLLMDCANPLCSWDVNQVVKTGQAHGLDRADIYGCLYFHVKAQFMEFARRFERFHIDIHLSQLDATIASNQLQKGELNPSLFGTNIKFDRVDTSNLADYYIGIPYILKDWSPLLNRENKHAVILVYLMNWIQKQPGASMKSLDMIKGSQLPVAFQKTASILGINPSTLFRNPNNFNTELYTIIGNIDTFIENDKQLSEYLASEGTERALEWYKLQLRVRNRIHPRRYGISLSDRPDALPTMTKTEFYHTYMVGGSNAGDRYLEFGH